jgi:SagB-type dehydrogenase family enzyme
MDDLYRSNQKEKGIGERFQEETKYTPENIGGHGLDWDHVPEPHKNYPGATATVPLPSPAQSPAANIWEVFVNRRSVRDYSSNRALPLRLLSSLLVATQGITRQEGNYGFRSAPSAGGLYPIETYLLARAVEGLEEGFYHFRSHMFDVEFIRPGNFSWALAQAALGQMMIVDAQVTFVWSAVVGRSTWKYRERAYRYIYIDAGHIAQNLYLAGTAAGLGVCAIGAFFDDRVNGLLGFDGMEETVLYLATVGWPVQGTRGSL